MIKEKKKNNNNNNKNFTPFEIPKEASKKKNKFNLSNSLKEEKGWSVNIFIMIIITLVGQIFALVGFFLNFFARVIFLFPIYVGIFFLEYMFYYPLKFIIVALYNFLYTLIRTKYIFLLGIFYFVINLFSKSAKNSEEDDFIFSNKHLSPETRIFFNRSTSPIMERVFYINKKFPQLHEIEQNFFKLHSPLTYRMQRFFNFFHPLDFRSWFWGLSANHFSFYNPAAWNRPKSDNPRFSTQIILAQRAQKAQKGDPILPVNDYVMSKNETQNPFLDNSQNFSKSWWSNVFRRYAVRSSSLSGFEYQPELFTARPSVKEAIKKKVQDLRSIQI